MGDSKATLLLLLLPKGSPKQVRFIYEKLHRTRTPK